MRICHGTWLTFALLALAALGGMGALYCAVGALADDNGTATQRVLETRYRAWKQWIADHPDPQGFSSRSNAWVYDNEPWHQLLALGPSALPYMAASLREHGEFAAAITQITGERFHAHRNTLATGHSLWTVDELPGFEQADRAPDGATMWLRWWNVDRFDVPARFNRLYAERQALVQQGDAKGAQEKLAQVQDLGIPVLPLLVDKIGQGAADLVPVMSALTNGGVKPDASAQDCADWWNAHQDEWTLPPATPDNAK